MPISSNNTRFSIDFSYEWDAPDGTIFEYPMKFYHGESGPVIQILIGHETVELPAAMFTETAEFLASQGAFGTPVVKKAFPSPLTLPSLTKKATPTAQVSKKTPKSDVPAFHSLETVNPEEEAPAEPKVERPNIARPSLRVDDNRPDVTGSEGVSEEEAQELAKLRKEAKANAEEKADSKKLTKRHRPE